MSPPLICAKVEWVATILAGADQINNGFGPSGRLAERGSEAAGLCVEERGWETKP